MKKIKQSLMLLLFVAGGIISMQAQEQLSMTTAKAVGENLSFTLNYGIEVDVDWGDGEFEKIISRGEPLTRALKGQTVNVKGFDITLLDCAGQSLTMLDVSQISELSTLLCQNNQIAALNVTQNKKLVKLNAAYNNLYSLSLTGLSQLQELVVNNNALPTLTVSGSKLLQTIVCNDNKIASLSLTLLTKLQTLWCHNNLIKTLDVSKSSNLTSLMCQNNEIGILNITGLASLTDVWCNSNQLNNLDVSTNSALVYLSANNARIENINYGTASKLTTLYLGKNRLGYAGLLSPSKLTNYAYTVQDSIRILATYDTDKDIDLTAQLATVDNVATGATFKWYDNGVAMAAGTDYSENNGKFRFNRTVAKLVGEISSTLFSELPSIFTIQTTVLQGTGVKQTIADASLSISATDGKLLIEAHKEMTVRIFNVNGQLIRSLSRLNGRIELELPRGVYFVNQNKIVL